jgi:threonine/homoserine/homoserine lactone efflux protein
MYLFLKAFLIGFSIAIPVGPIGILCIRRSLTHGFKIGLATGLGAALADGIYAVVASFGLTLISSFLLKHQRIIIAGGTIFLYYLGIKALGSKLSTQSELAKVRGFTKTLIETLLLTLANPITIVSSTALFVGFGLAQESRDFFSASIISIGIFCGSAAWFFTLSALIAIFSARCSPSFLHTINKLSGVILIAFATIALFSLFQPEYTIDTLLTKSAG